MKTVIDIRMMAVADLPAVPEIQADCYTEVTPESKAFLHVKLSAECRTSSGSPPGEKRMPGHLQSTSADPLYRTKVRYPQYGEIVIVPESQGKRFMKTQRKRTLALTKGAP